MQLYFIRHGQSANNAVWDQTGSDAMRSEDPELTAVGRRQAEIVAQFLRDGPSLAHIGGVVQPRPVLSSSEQEDTGIHSAGQPAPLASLNLFGRPAKADEEDAHNLRGFGITHLYTSLMARAVATADIISKAIGRPPVAWMDLHEGGGIFVNDPETQESIGRPGKPRSFFEQHYTTLVLPDDLDERGWWNRPFEEREERIPRAARFLRDLVVRHGKTGDGHIGGEYSEDRVAVVSHGAFFNYLIGAMFNMPTRRGYWFSMNNAAISRLDFREDEIAVQYINRVDFLPKELLT